MDRPSHHNLPKMPYSKNQNYEPFLMRIPPGLKDRVREAAHLQRRSMASLACTALEVYLDRLVLQPTVPNSTPRSGEPPRTDTERLPVVLTT